MHEPQPLDRLRHLSYKSGKLYRFKFKKQFLEFGKGLDGDTVLFIEFVVVQNILKCRVLHQEQVLECPMFCLSGPAGTSPIFDLEEVQETDDD